jgi:hypothetical protein
MKTFLSRTLPVIFMILLYLAVFVPYLLYNGFIMDDWTVVNIGYYNTTYCSTVKSWFPFLTMRPLSSLFFGLAFFFKLNPFYYNLVNLGCYFSGLLILSYCLRKLFGGKTAYLFLLISPLCVISNVWIFSAPNLIPPNFSIFLWSLSLFFIYRHTISQKKFYYYLSYLLILLGWLIYDMIIFLTVCNIFLPVYIYFRDHDYTFRLFIKKAMKNIIPVLIITAIMVFYQKIITPMIGGQDISRLKLNISTLYLLPGTIANYILALLLQFPILLLTSFKYLSADNYCGVHHTRPSSDRVYHKFFTDEGKPR